MRITASVAVLVAVGLSGAGSIVYVIEAARTDRRGDERAATEFAELAAFQASRVDPTTGGRFGDIDSLLSAYLATTVPDANQTLVAWYGGAVRKQSAVASAPVTDTFRAAADSVATDNGTTTIIQNGERIRLDAQTLRFGKPGQVGALIVVTYVDRARDGLRDTMGTYAAVTLAALALITAFAAWQSGRLLAPLRVLRETVQQITETDTSRRLPVRGNDDITALTRTVNGMLDRLDSAFAEQRRFLDDAGHELKTPLTVLRGHLELLDVADPQETAQTLELLLDEVDRMTRLVADLVVLAKSGRPDFATRQLVDAAQLTADVLAKARGLADRSWRLEETSAATVYADEQRLTQALLALCHNAAKHTGVGDTIALSCLADDGRIRWAVRDTGPGVPPGERQRIFERFARGAVPPGDDGFGLGLSIVAAIASAHGGSVHVEDALPAGARFVLTLPADMAGSQEPVSWPRS